MIINRWQNSLLVDYIMKFYKMSRSVYWKYFQINHLIGVIWVTLHFECTSHEMWATIKIILITNNNNYLIIIIIILSIKKGLIVKFFFAQHNSLDLSHRCFSKKD